MSNDAQLRELVPASLCEWLAKEIHRVLAPLVTTGTNVLDLETSVECVPVEAASSRGDAQRVLVNIRCADPNRALGRFPPFSSHSPSGYFEPYVQGYVRSLLERKGIDLPEYGSEIVLRAAGGTTSNVEPPPMSRIVRLDDALASGALARGSPLHEAMTEFGLRYLLMSGRTISGPSPAVLDALKSLRSRIDGRTVVDLFTGSQGHALASRRLGASRAVCVDWAPPIGEDGHLVNPAQEDPGVLRIRGDALALPLRIGTDDVVICDPWYEGFGSLCVPILRQVAMAGIVVVNAGDRPDSVHEPDLGPGGPWKRSDVERFGETSVIFERIPDGNGR